MSIYVLIELLLLLVIIYFVSKNRSSSYNPIQGDRLNENQTLNTGDQKTSQDGKYRYRLEADGKLALYNSAGTEIWSLKPESKPGSTGRYLKLETNGNLVMYDQTPRGDLAAWSTNTGGQGKSNSRFFVIQNDGNLILWAKNSQSRDIKLWKTDTVGK